MSTTLQTGLNRLRAKLDTITGSGGDWGSELTDYLNEAQRDIIFDLPDACWNSTLVGTNTTTLSVTAVSHIDLIDHAADWLKTISVELTDTDSETYPAHRLPSFDALRNRISSSNYTTTGTSGIYYAFRGEHIAIGPVMSGQYVVETYIKVPTTMTATTSTFSVPDAYVDRVVDKAVVNPLLQKGELDKAGAWKAKYDSFIAAEWRRFGLEPPQTFLHAPQPKG